MRTSRRAGEITTIFITASKDVIQIGMIFPTADVHACVRACVSHLRIMFSVCVYTVSSILISCFPIFYIENKINHIHIVTNMYCFQSYLQGLEETVFFKTFYLFSFKLMW